MAAATDKEREEAIPKGTEFMPVVDTDQLAAAFKKERVGKPKSVLEACLLRRQKMGLRDISKRIRVSYSTVRGRLMRMKDVGLKRRFDKKHSGPKAAAGRACRARYKVLAWQPSKPSRVSGRGAGSGHGN